MAKRRTFFEKLTGGSPEDDYEDVFEDEEEKRPALKGGAEGWIEEESQEGQLSVDVYQTPEQIIVKALVAGVKPEDLDISITRDMVTIKGKREAHKEVTDENYFSQELYWGSFTRTILLPQEVDSDAAEAAERHGLLTIRLPKINKGKQTKLRVRAGS